MSKNLLSDEEIIYFSLGGIKNIRYFMGRLGKISKKDRRVIIACLNLAYELLKNPEETWKHKQLFDVLATLWSER